MHSSITAVVVALAGFASAAQPYQYSQPAGYSSPPPTYGESSSAPPTYDESSTAGIPPYGGASSSPAPYSSATIPPYGGASSSPAPYSSESIPPYGGASSSPAPYSSATIPPYGGYSSSASEYSYSSYATDYSSIPYGGYPSSVEYSSYPTGYSSSPYGGHSSDVYSSYPTGYSFTDTVITYPTPPYSTGVTTSYTTYTTVTTCPVTYTKTCDTGYCHETSLTTKTQTITSCVYGCHSYPTPTPYKPTHYYPGTETKTVTIPTTITETITTFTKCSTPVNTHYDTTYYSTWLTQTTYTTEYETSTCITYYPKPTGGYPGGPVQTPPSYPHGGNVCTDCYQPTTIYGPSYPGETCGPAKTVVSTYVITVTEKGGYEPTYYPSEHSEIPYPTGAPPVYPSSYLTGVPAPSYSTEIFVYPSASSPAYSSGWLTGVPAPSYSSANAYPTYA